jgi:chemotaxis protein histidine kinase CheA
MPEQNGIQDLDDQILNRMLKDFLEEAREHLDQLNLNLIQLEEYPDDENLLDQIFRISHTLKGSAAFAGLKEVSEIARKIEKVFGDARKGSFKITARIIEVLFEGLDVLTTLIDRTAGSEHHAVDITRILEKLDHIPGLTIPEFEEKAEKVQADVPDSRELLDIYKKSYDQLAALKHLVYSSVHLSDLESLALLFSKQIDERMPPQRNAVWLVENDHNVVEIARDGKLVEKENRRVLEITSSELMTRIIYEQLVVWTSSLPEARELMPEFDSPIIFPIKAQHQALGFIVLDPEETAEVELYQFVSQFAAMILNISKLHQKVEEQRKELDEMTEILFKQNAQLSSLYHVEVELMKVSDPVDLCRILAEATVNDLEASRAAAFLIDPSSQELIGASESGGLEGIVDLRLPVDKEKPIKQSLESGRIISSRNYAEKLQLGSNLLEDWLVLCLKGREHTHGLLVVEVKDEDIGDPVSILANYSGILLDNIVLQKKIR